MPILKVSKLISDTLFKQIRGTRDIIATTIQVTSDITQKSLRDVRGKKAET